MGEIRRLNALRGLAAIVVLISHYSNETLWLDGALGRGGGQVGVMLFFVLSGFLMAYLYLERPFTAAGVYRYGTARFARVVPLFVLIVLISFVLHQLGVTKIFYFIPSVKFMMAHLLFLNGVDVLWTIPPEIHFYLLFVGLWWLFGRSRILFLLLILAALVATFAAGVPNFKFKLFGIPADIRLLWGLPYFLSGTLMGWLYRHWQLPLHRRSNVYILALPLLLVLYPGITRYMGSWQHGFWQDPAVLAVVVSVFFAVVFLVKPGNRLLENPVADFFGRISFSLYLLHRVLLALLPDQAQQSPGLWLVVFLAAAIAVSALSYWLIEAPLQARLRGAASVSR
jgi:peptidoglycan/LPS O-acetylase OafA/YrhL